jgi:hypothetical protein
MKLVAILGMFMPPSLCSRAVADFVQDPGIAQRHFTQLNIVDKTETLIKLLPDRVVTSVQARRADAAVTQALPDFLGGEISLKRVLIVAGIAC